MTTQEYVKKEAEKAVNEMFPKGNEYEAKMIARQEHYNGIIYGLFSGIELAKEMIMEITVVNEKRAIQLIEIFLTERNEK